MKRSTIGKLSSAQRHLQALQGEITNRSRPDRFLEDLKVLQKQLADLEVAYLELEQQNEELQSTRQEMERQRHRYLQLFEEAPSATW